MRELLPFSTKHSNLLQICFKFYSSFCWLPFKFSSNFFQILLLLVLFPLLLLLLLTLPLLPLLLLLLLLLLVLLLLLLLLLLSKLGLGVRLLLPIPAALSGAGHMPSGIDAASPAFVLGFRSCFPL